MIILTIRTDKPESEIGLFENQAQLAHEVWPAHRQLAETLHKKLEALLSTVGRRLSDVEGIVVFQGPGSFTGLRIGVSTANALAYGLDVPLVAVPAVAQGVAKDTAKDAAQDEWIEHGIERLLAGETDKVVLPEYGAPVHITQQKK